MDFCITQLKAQGPSRSCNESKKQRRDYRVTVFLPQVEEAAEHCSGNLRECRSGKLLTPNLISQNALISWFLSSQFTHKPVNPILLFLVVK